MPWQSILQAPPREPAYHQLVGCARLPAFFRDYAVPDTIDGRFDMLALIIAVASSAAVRCKRMKLARDLQESLVAQLDESFRQMGVSDLKVGQRVKDAFTAYNGRQYAYAEALEDIISGSRSDTGLQEALKRNLYRKAAPEQPVIAGMAATIYGLYCYLCAAYA